MISRLRAPSLLLWLAGLWVALWGEVSPGNIVGGLAVAIGVLAVARPVGVTGLEGTFFRPLAALHYLLYFLRELVKSSLVVAWEIITPRSQINRAIIAVPMHTTSAGVVTLLANSITLTPGTLTIDVTEDGWFYVHWLNVLSTDEEEAAKHVLRRFEWFIQRIFE